MLTCRTFAAMASLARRLLLTCFFALPLLARAAPPLTIGYSDWPGWVAWQVAIDKGWFREAGVDVKFEWFDYSASLDAFSAGKLDAVLMTNGDALLTGSAGAKSTLLMITDYSSGNDTIIAKPGIKSLADLKGKKVAVERGLVEHLLLVNGLKKIGLKETDVQLVNAKTNEMPQMLASADIAAVGAWQPVSGEAMRAVPGAKVIYSSANEPGLIYDVLAANPSIAKSRRSEWLKVLKVWDRVVNYVLDPKTQADAVKVMAAKSGIAPADYLPLLKGTHLLSLEEGKRIYMPGEGYNSLYGATRRVDAFNVSSGVYKAPEKVDSYLDASFTQGK